jgi:hypothetical protein
MSNPPTQNPSASQKKTPAVRLPNFSAASLGAALRTVASLNAAASLGATTTSLDALKAAASGSGALDCLGVVTASLRLCGRWVCRENYPQA